jgi:hypothetical protein
LRSLEPRGWEMPGAPGRRAPSLAPKPDQRQNAHTGPSHQQGQHRSAGPRRKGDEPGEGEEEKIDAQKLLPWNRLTNYRDVREGCATVPSCNGRNQFF